MRKSGLSVPGPNRPRINPDGMAKRPQAVQSMYISSWGKRPRFRVEQHRGIQGSRRRGGYIHHRQRCLVALLSFFGLICVHCVPHIGLCPLCTSHWTTIGFSKPLSNPPHETKLNSWRISATLLSPLSTAWKVRASSSVIFHPNQRNLC